MIPTFDIYHHYVYCRNLPESLEHAIKHLCTYVKENAFYTRAHHRGNVPRVYLYKYGKFPTGYLKELKALVYVMAAEAEWNDHREYLKAGVWDWIPFELYDHQLQAYHYGQGGGRGVFQMPPGTGKTELAIALCLYYGGKVLWLTSSKNVQQQTIRRCERYGLTRVDVVLPQSLMRKYTKFNGARLEKELSQYTVLIVDECHHTQATSWFKLAMHCNAPYRFGISATPCEREGGNMELHAAVGPILFEKDYPSCYTEGILSRPMVTFVSYKSSGQVWAERYPEGKRVDGEILCGECGSRNWSQSKVRGTKTILAECHTCKHVWQLDGLGITAWDDLQRKGIAENDSRNLAAVEEARRYLRLGIRPLVITRLVDSHALMLSGLFHAKGLRVMTATGKSDNDHRDKCLKALNEGEIDCLISSCIFGEGQDMPDLSAVVNMAGGNSVIQTTQIAGRVMRPNTPAFVTDFVDTCHPILKEHSSTRRSTYKSMSVEFNEITYE